MNDSVPLIVNHNTSPPGGAAGSTATEIDTSSPNDHGGCAQASPVRHLVDPMEFYDPPASNDHEDRTLAPPVRRLVDPMEFYDSPASNDNSRWGRLLKKYAFDPDEANQASNAAPGHTVQVSVPAVSGTASEQASPASQSLFPAGTPSLFAGSAPATGGGEMALNLLQAKDPLPEELKNRFLASVPSFRIGSRLFFWAGTHFQAVDDNEAKSRIKAELREFFLISHPTGLLNTLLGLLKIEPSVVGSIGYHPDLVALANGTLDLRSLTLSPPNPEHHICHRLPISWSGPQPCPVFNRFLAQVAGGDQELSLRIQEAMGYLLCSDYRPKRFVVFQGVGDSGKSVLGNLLASFFEPADRVSLADYQFGARFALSFIADAAFCSGMDLSDGVIDEKAVSVLKQITGGDIVSIEPKGRTAYTDYVRCKVLFATNNSVRLKHRDAAFAARILLIPFLHAVPPALQDRDLLEKLKAEKTGILFQVFNAYREVVARNYCFSGESRFGFTDANLSVEDQRPDSLASFITACCKLDPNAYSSTLSLHEAFQNYCHSYDLADVPDRAVFSRLLNTQLQGKLRSEKRRINGHPTNGYWGIELLQSNMNVKE